MVAGRKGLSLLEALIAAIIASVAIIPYLTLSSSETRSTMDLAQRAKATSLARNTLVLMESGHRRELYQSPPDNNGIYTLNNPDITLSDSYLATGKGLSQWIAAQRRRGYFLYNVSWNPNPPDLSGISQESDCGELSCTVGWLADGKKKKQLSLKRITWR